MFKRTLLDGKKAVYEHPFGRKKRQKKPFLTVFWR